MDHNMEITGVEQVPEIYCAITVQLSKDVDIAAITSELYEIGIHNLKVRKPKCEPLVCLDIAIVRNERFWDLSSALEKMFLQVEFCLYQFKSIVETYNGDICIDIAFYQYGSYPALEISGHNMEIIHYLEANISIDPYDCKSD